MPIPLTGRQAELRALISTFLSERLDVKVADLSDDDPKRAELQAQFEPAAWLDSAARRVPQIQAVTHSLKPIHPDAKGSSLFVNPTAQTRLAEVATCHLGPAFDVDVVGNAAALDVYKLLKLEHGGQKLHELAVAANADLQAALSDDPDQAAAWMAAFAGLAQAKATPASHTHAKQLYWPTGGNVHDDASYHLLAPLYPTSLIHRAYKAIETDRFGEAAKTAREARKAKVMHEQPVHDYPEMAVQHLGGTKPQNISQLNSERRGNNLLLASLPPTWKKREPGIPLRTASLFHSYGWRVQRTVGQLRRFLESDPAKVLETRERRNILVDELLAELVDFAAEVRLLDPAWTKDPACRLPAAQRRWLAPHGTDNDLPANDLPMPDAIKQVASDFSHWLNDKLGNPLPMGDVEYRYWRKLARLRLTQAEWEVADVE